MRKIIGVCGLMGSGKGTVADMLVEEHGFEKISFGDAIKDAAAVMFGWRRDLLEGDTKESREWREQRDNFWSQETGRDMTPRLALQLLGSECMRVGFHDDIWVSIVKRKMLANPTTNYVIPDLRFENEIGIIQGMGGEIWSVRRGKEPIWWDTAILTNNSTRETEWILYDNNEHMETAYPEIHMSEWSWINDDSTYDQVIRNDDSLEALRIDVNKRLKGL